MNHISIRVYGLLINEHRQVLVSDEYIRGQHYTKFPGGGLEFGEGLREGLPGARHGQDRSRRRRRPGRDHVRRREVARLSTRAAGLHQAQADAHLLERLAPGLQGLFKQRIGRRGEWVHGRGDWG